jgi:hypothetical protein
MGKDARMTGSLRPDRNVAADRHGPRGHGARQRPRNRVVVDADMSQQTTAGPLELSAGLLWKRSPATAQRSSGLFETLIGGKCRLPGVHLLYFTCVRQLGQVAAPLVPESRP